MIHGGSNMLHDFIVANRERIIKRARERVRTRVSSKSAEAKVEHGVPLFLSQLVDALMHSDRADALHVVGTDVAARQRIVGAAALHGEELLRSGFSVAHVVHGYGDVCQVVTELAQEADAAISPAEFQVFNQCLDDAIAGAVTAYGRLREADIETEGTERIGVLAHELRNLLSTAMLSFDVLKRGTVGFGGSTAAIHSRSLTRLHALIERSLAEVRLEAGLPRFEHVSVNEFLEEVEVSAGMQADAQALQLSVTPADTDATIAVDRQLLGSAVSNLLQNAFKFTRAGGSVTLATRLTDERLFIDVSDECGGLPPGKAEELFVPFAQAGADRSGLGLGLSIALSAVHANRGELRVQDVPGHGCVFTIDLPREPTRPGAVASAEQELQQDAVGEAGLDGMRSTA